jgi:hypothetical protein
LTDFHLGNLPPQPYDAALVERCRLADLARRPWVPKAPQVPTEYVPPVNVAPVRVASAFLSHELAAKPVPVATLMHGLRKAQMRRLAEAGASAKQIASISGHKTLREVERYTAAADQKHLSRGAISKLKVGPSA